MSRLRTASTIGLVTAAIGVLLARVPVISSLEDSLGLRAFFQLRGSLPPPAGVVVVSIDEPAAVRLGLRPNVRDWPRAHHARLIDQLVQLGTSVIVFDVQFFQPRSVVDDEMLAQAIARSKRVVLVQKLERKVVPAGEIWHHDDPLPSFVAGAVGVAPVPIPDTPLVSWFWAFLTTVGGADIPTLPSIALQAGAGRVAGAFTDALRIAGVDAPDLPFSTPGELLPYMQELRRRLKGNTSALARALQQLATTGQIDSDGRQLVRALLGLYTGDGAAYLNFYGPPGSVCTVPYDVVFEGGASPCRLKDATVFVGVGRSREDRAEQIDTYHTVYERADGVDFSGVELHATAFANLLTGTALRPMNRATMFAILLCAGFVLGGSGYLMRTRRRRLRGSIHARLEASVVVAVLVASYCVVAYVLFARYYVIVPIVVPLAVQLPTALILGLLARPAVHEEQVPAVCVAADASGSTAIGQRLPHDAYAVLMTEYNRALVRCVTTRGGLALPPHGDGFVSLWIERTRTGDTVDSSTRFLACEAALEMAAAADRFNQARPEAERLPLRLGLTVGAVTLRSDADRGAFEAVGDAVNIAARLQELNRELSTRVLASEAVIAGMEEQLALNPIQRNLELRGVATPPRVFEVVANSNARGV